MWAIFDHPLDYPHHFVVRRCFCIPWKEGMPGLCAERLHEDDTHPPVLDVVPRLANTLDEARSLVPLGLYRQPRQEGDDPFIVETWF